MVEEKESEILRETDLTRKYCMGEGKQFENQRCPNFDVLTKECRLLRDKPLKALYKQERCLPEWEFQWRAHRILKKTYPKSLRGEDLDLEEFVFGRHDEERDHKAILDYKVDVPTISRMYGLINLSLGREIVRILRRKQLVSPKKKCGTCEHRGPIKPHTCQLENFPGRADGNPFPNKHFGTERMADDSPCDGYEPVVPDLDKFKDHAPPMGSGFLRSDSALWLGARTWKGQLEQFEALLDVPVMFKAIRRCAANARPLSKAYKIFERWYEDNTFIYDTPIDFAPKAYYEACPS